MCKKTIIILLLLINTGIYAGKIKPAYQTINASKPEQSYWIVGSQALYFQSVYQVEGNYPRTQFDTPAIVGHTPFLSPNWGWGFMIEGGYHWAGNKDISLAWYHLNYATTSNNTNFPYFDAVQGFIYDAPENLSLHPMWDSALTEFGRIISFDDGLQNLRVHSGVEYARIASTLSGHIPGGVFVDGNKPSSTLQEMTQYETSDFNGFGPRGGVDINQKLPYGFGIYAKGAGGLLVGRMFVQNDRIQIGNRPAGYAALNSSYNSGSHTAVVPMLEAKLGLNYSYTMKRLIQNQLLFDAGWMWKTYFDAYQFLTNESGRGAAVYPNRTDASQTNFSVQGVYFGASWKGNC